MVKKITAEILRKDPVLRDYLGRATFAVSRRGDGTFVGNYNVAPEVLRAYGVVLPSGGMIIPNIKPEELRAVVMTDHDSAKQADEARRSADRAKCIKKAVVILGSHNLGDVEVVEKRYDDHHNIGSTAVVEVVLKRGEDVIMVIRSEKEPHRLLGEAWNAWEDWRVSEMSGGEFAKFVAEEVRLVPLRAQFSTRIKRLIEMSHEVGQLRVGEDGWDRPRVELFLYEDYTRVTDWGFFGRRCKNVHSAHRLMYRQKLYELTERDVMRLEAEVGARSAQAKERKRVLRERFIATQGVFSYERRTYEPSQVRHSLVDGRVKDDSWTERHYFLGDMELTGEEYEWLQSIVSEVPVPEGYIRVPNDTNELLRVPPVPDRSKDVLVVIGKTGSRRGVWSYGEWFRGHPSEFTMSLGSLGTRGRLKNIMLNGQEVSGINPRQWTDPKEIARLALEQARVEPTEERVVALARYYVEQGLVRDQNT